MRVGIEFFVDCMLGILDDFGVLIVLGLEDDGVILDLFIVVFVDIGLVFVEGGDSGLVIVVLGDVDVL